MVNDPKDTNFNTLDAASYANPGAKTTLTTGPSGHLYRWEWDGKSHELLIPSEKLIFQDLILERLFEAAIEMAKR
ncbi:hypothetical protein [Leclercia sp. UBA2479]|uniref:hypothetical protein n=1 Tax=Leclercia sp. UBA2479 TaxID=1946738 RepID=UPI00257CDCAC|nr:hypothetical protein [Leclercia sp. UBA2479]